MPRKPIAKEQREMAKKAALAQRLKDIACGAYGGHKPLQFDDSEDIGPLHAVMGLAAFGRWVGGIQNAFGIGENDSYLLAPRCLHNYDTIESAVEFLYLHGYGK